MPLCLNLPRRMIDLHLNQPPLAAGCRTPSVHRAPRTGDAPIMIDPDALMAALPVLWAEGYQVLNLGGGQPLLHTRLADIARSAQSLGMATRLQTKASLLSARLLDRLGDHIDAYCLDLDDGVDSLFTDPSRIGGLVSRVGFLTERGKRVRLIRSFKARQLRDLTRLYALSEEIGVSEISANPAIDASQGPQATENQSERLYAMVALLDAAPGGPSVSTRLRRPDNQADFMRLAPLICKKNADAPLARQIDPLVITHTGALAPFACNVDRFHHIGQIGEDLADQIEIWRRYSRAELARAASQAICAEPNRGGYVDFQAEIAATVERRFSVA